MNTRAGYAYSTILAGIVLVLFYSLALHMRQSLGEYPNSIGENGFPPNLVIHAKIAVGAFTLLTWSVIFGWLPAIGVALAAPRVILYYVVHLAASFLAFIVMLFAPSKFLTWWWD